MPPLHSHSSGDPHFLFPFLREHHEYVDYQRDTRDNGECSKSKEHRRESAHLLGGRIDIGFFVIGQLQILS